MKFSWHAVIKAVLHLKIETEMSETRKGTGLRGKLNKVVLAYSGGLDTSVIVPWLRYISFCSFSVFWQVDAYSYFSMLDFPIPLYIPVDKYKGS